MDLIKSLVTSRSKMKEMLIGMKTSMALTMRASLTIEIVKAITMSMSTCTGI